MQGPETQIRNWILQELSTPRPIFGNLPACPYAAEALLNSKVAIDFFSPKDLFAQIENHLSTFNQTPFEVHVIGVTDSSLYSVQSVETFVWEMREKYYSRDLWLLFDHPDDPEAVSDFSLKQGEYLLFFVQSLSSVCKKSRELQKTNYYKMWEPDYFAEVVQKRESYYQRMINTSERAFS